MQVAFMSQHSNAGVFSGTETIRYRYVLMPDDRLAAGLNHWLGEMGFEAIPVLEKNSLCIVIAGFEATSRLEDTLSRWTQRICSQAGTFNLELNNFSAEPPNTIFLRIQDINPIRSLIGNLRKLDMYLTGNGQDPIQPAARYFLPVCERVPAKSFENLAYRLGRAEFHLKVAMQSMVLQKLVRGKWENVQRFSFSHSPVMQRD